MSGVIEHAVQVLKRGGLIAYATEYCFGLGCDPLNERALARLLRVKHRPSHKGLILLAGSPDQLAPYVVEIPANVAATWPGPHTWLLEPNRHSPRGVVGGHSHIAARVTAHAQAARLCRVADMAIVSTSANRAGQQPARSFREVVRRFGLQIDYVLPGRVGELKAPTSIRNAATGESVRVG